MGKTVLILGGGTGGVVAANVLRKLLDGRHRVVVVDRKDKHYFQASYPLLMAGLRNPEQITRSLRRLLEKEFSSFRPRLLKSCPMKTKSGQTPAFWL